MTAVLIKFRINNSKEEGDKLMICPKCKTEHEGKFCPSCGAPKKKKGMGCLVAVGIVLVLAIIGALMPDSDTDSESTTAKVPESTTQVDSKQEDATEAESEPTTEATTAAPQKEAFKKTFGPGYYTAGTHFPVGKYKLVAKKGMGNVFSSAGLNQIMGSEDDGFSIQEYNNEKFKKGDVLNITSTLYLSLSCKDADMDMSKYDNPLTKSVSLDSGKYIAGEDFEAGVYDIVTTKGMGNLFSSNGINQIMNIEDDDMSTKTFKNAPLEDGVELELSGVSVKLVPSK